MKNEQPRTISVIIPTYNRREALAGALASVFAQTQAPAEIIVVDDGSMDGTGEWLQASFPDVRYIYQKNQGVSAARNTGIQAATGEFVAFLDSDDRWTPQKLAWQLQAFQEQPNLLMTAGNRLKVKAGADGSPIVTSPATVAWTTISFLWLLAGKHLPTPSVMVRRSVLLDAGGFDPQLKTGEDWDLWLQIASIGPVAYTKTPLVLVTESEDSISRDRTEIYRNNIKVLKKWDPDCNARAPVSRFIFRNLVRYHFCTAVARLARRGMVQNALELWREVREAFALKSSDRFLFQCYLRGRGVKIKL